MLQDEKEEIVIDIFGERHINYEKLSKQPVAHLLNIIKGLDKKLDEVLEEKSDIEILLENQTEHNDSITDELLTDKEDLQLMMEATSEHADAIAEDLEQKRLLIRQTFGRYLSDEIVNTILDDEDGLKLGGKREEITILTSDLRGFTALSETQEPENVVSILNFYLDKMEKIITQYGGTIDEFMGDGILVLFGAPSKREDDIQRAIACAIAMQLCMPEINVQMEEWGFPHLDMGIGINTGDVVVGNIGSENRTKYGVVGANVNLTYRIESYTLGGQILISQSTYEKVKQEIDINEEMKVSPKGVKEPISIYNIKGIRDSFQLQLMEEENHLDKLTHPININYVVLNGKHLGDNAVKGSITYLSDKYAYILLDKKVEKPEILTNLKIDREHIETSLYAKVVDPKSCHIVGEEVTQTTKGIFISFTSNNKVVKQVLFTV